jgi:hypothetical protein
MIDYVERKATVVFKVGDRVEAFTGWVMISRSGAGVSARKIGGSRRWLLTSLSNVLEVKPFGGSK